MKNLSLAVVALLLLSTPLLAQTPTPVPAGSRYVWDQGAATLAEAQAYTYKLYTDNLSPSVVVAGVTCTAAVAASPAGTFPCSAAFVAATPGVAHSIVITATNASGESAASNAYAYIFVVLPATPRNLRKQ